jgi:hypothetical protein
VTQGDEAENASRCPTFLLALRVICCLFRDEFAILIRSVSISISGKGTGIHRLHIFVKRQQTHTERKRTLPL